MKKIFALTLAMLAAGPLWGADASLKDEVTGAATALGNQASYSWHTTVEAGSGSYRRGPTDGKTEKGGYTTVSISANDTTFEFVIQGTNAAIKTSEDGWQSAVEAAQEVGNGFNMAALVARMAQNFRTPAVEAGDLAGQTQSLAAGTNGISGELTEDGAKSLLLFRRGESGAGSPTVANAKGSITLWLADGQLVKYQTHVTGTISFNHNDHDVDRITTTEIKDVGTAKVEVPDDAKKKLE